MRSDRRVIYNLIAIVVVFLLLVGLNAIVRNQWEAAKEESGSDAPVGETAPPGDSVGGDTMAADTSAGR